MNGRSEMNLRSTPKAAALALALAGFLAGPSIHAQGAAPVVIEEDDATYTLRNDLIVANISKRNGSLNSLRYREVEMLDGRGRSSGYWSHTAASPTVIDRVTIDPKANGGERGRNLRQRHFRWQEDGERSRRKRGGRY